MILELGAGSSALARGAAALLLSAHITAGIVGICSGAAALLARKGSPLHRRAGNWFFISILVMATIGSVTSPFLPIPNWSNLIGGGFTIYLVATSWVTIRRKEGSVGRFEVAACLTALGVAALAVALGLRAASSPTGSLDGTPMPAYLIIAAGAMLAAIGDLRVVVRRGVWGAQRITRHLWRMCVALFIATGSFFLGQQKVFPLALRGSPLLFLPEIAIVGSLIFWLVRVRFTDRFRSAVAGKGALAKRPHEPSKDRGPLTGAAERTELPQTPA